MLPNNNNNSIKNVLLNIYIHNIILFYPKNKKNILQYCISCWYILIIKYIIIFFFYIT